VYGWLGITHPVVFILTDGSGHSGKTRLYQTTEILKHVGARPGSIYGRFTDVELYQAILESDFGFFFEIANELAGALVTEKIEFVVGDAIEGYNPVHDVCRLMIDAAVRCARSRNHAIENYDVLVADGVTDDSRTDVVTIDLDAHSLSQKLRSVYDYHEIDRDVATIVEEEGLASFTPEQVRRVVDDSGSYQLVDPPSYELHGEKQVAAGYYDRVLRYRQHMLPLAEALQSLG
jgi:AcrR family transcriptional regulator